MQNNKDLQNALKEFSNSNLRLVEEINQNSYQKKKNNNLKIKKNSFIASIFLFTSFYITKNISIIKSGVSNFFIYKSPVILGNVFVHTKVFIVTVSILLSGASIGTVAYFQIQPPTMIVDDFKSNIAVREKMPEVKKNIKKVYRKKKVLILIQK